MCQENTYYSLYGAPVDMAMQVNITCSSRRGSRRRRRARSTSAVSRALADSVGRSGSRHATRPRVPPGSSGRRQPADTRHTPAPAQDPAPRRPSSCQRRLGPGVDGRRPWSLSRPLTVNKQRCCWLPTQSLPGTDASLHYRLITPATAAAAAALCHTLSSVLTAFQP